MNNRERLVNLSRAEVESMGLAGKGLIPANLGKNSLGYAKQLNTFYIAVDAADQSLGRYLAYTGFWEAWITSYVTDIVKEGWTCLDIGANMGYFTFLMAELVGPSGVVVAYEPNPLYAQLLRKSKEQGGYDNTIIHEVALGDKNEDLVLSIPGNLGGSATTISTFDDTWGPETHHTVKGMRLDDISPGHVDFIKMDIEGAEQVCLAGAENMIARNPNLLMMIEWDSRRFDNAFADELLAKYHVGYVDTDGVERHMWEGRLKNSHDIEMITLRQKKHANN